MSSLFFTGFDSAWGGTQRGAFCDLRLDKATKEIEILGIPKHVNWTEAVAEVGFWVHRNHHIVAIDQGLIVPNLKGIRPVERTLAQALGHMHCGAYPSNSSNLSCYGPNAGIWKFQSALGGQGYVQSPMSIPHSDKGRFFFECYPHPAIIALLGLSQVLKYKYRHRSLADWKLLLCKIHTWNVKGMDSVLQELSSQSKANEDAIDAIVCAYVAVLWWSEGVNACSMLGDLKTGYMVTPHNATTIACFKKAFGGLMNIGGTAPAYSSPLTILPIPTLPSAVVRVLTNMPNENPVGTTPEAGAGDEDWSGEVDLFATDTANLWRNGDGVIVNGWMELNRFVGWRLLVKFLDEDGQPEIAFVPFDNHGERLKGMKADRDAQPEVWWSFVAGATKEHQLSFRVKYKYLPMVP